jgi:two-component system sensor histidine kinase PilS (NtrC family)
MNRVIENVLQLSRRQQTVPQRLDLKPWLEQFVGETREAATDGSRFTCTSLVQTSRP